MRTALAVFLSAASAFSNDVIEVAPKEKDAPARTVFIKLEKVTSADRYDVELIPVKLQWTEALSFRTYAGALRLRLTPSQYRIRTRSVAKGGNKGNWGEWKDFNVPFRSVLSRTPNDKALVQSTGYENQIVTFEWPKEKTAAGYYIEVRDTTNTPIKKVSTVNTWLNHELPAGKEYTWCVLPVSELPPKVSSSDCLFTSFKIREKRPGLPRTLTGIEPRKEALGYQFEIIRFEDAVSLGDPVTVQSLEPNLDAQLEPGQYELRARTLFDKNYKTAWSSPKKFFVPHEPPVPITPLPGVEIEAGENESGIITLNWREEPNAADYTVLVFKPDGQLIFSTTTEKTTVDVNLPEDSKYHWQVIAYSKGEPRRSPASTNLDVKSSSEFYIKPYFPFAFTAAENPAPTYGWARYTMSSASYKSESYDDNAVVRQSIQAGQLDLAAGYWHRKSRMGLLLNGGIQNYRTSRDSAFQKNGSFNIGYRSLGEGNQRTRIWLGYAYREIPSLNANPTTRVYRISHLTSAGPQIIISTSNTFNEEFGYQFHGRFFKGIQDLGSPTGAPQESAIALSASAALTYRLSPTSIGLIGYTFQLDNGSYSSLDTPGKSNTTTLTGHYLTLGLEMAIGTPRR